MVAAILANPRYTGWQVWNRQRTDLDLVDRGNTGLGHKQVQRWNLPQGWVISRKPAHPALVSEADFITAQDATAPCGSVGLAVRRYLLAGLLACDQCGRRRESAWSNGKPGYRCRYGHTSATRPNPGRPKNAYVREDQILPHLAAIAILLACDDQARGGDSVQLTTPCSSSKPTGSRDPADRNSACESSGAAARASVPGHPVRTSQLLPCSCPRRIWARHPRTRSFASRYCHDHPPPRHDLRPAVPRIVIDLGYAGTYRHVTWPSVRGVHAHCRLRWRPGITPGITRGWARLIPAVIRVRTSWRSFRQAGRRPCCGPGTGSLRR